MIWWKGYFLLRRIQCPPTPEEYFNHLILTTVRAQGIAARNEIIHLRKADAAIFDRALNHLQEENKIVPVKISGEKIYFTLPDYVEQSIRLPDRVLIISPFDNLIIWRKRLKEIFGFDYTLECYLPPGKRTYGYFCLPILYKDKFIGRIDVKAERQTGQLQIKQEFWNGEIKGMKSNPLYKEALNSFAVFNRCTKIL